MPVDCLPLTAGELAAALAPFGRSRALPGAAYTSAEVLAFDLERWFAGSWACVGRPEDVPTPGDQRAVAVAGETVLLVRDGQGRLGAWFDVCRHRGSELLAAGARVSAAEIRCPYHGWLYRLDGSLLAAPRMDGAEGFRTAEHGLTRVRLAHWQGFLFVNLSGDAPALEEHAGDLDDLVSPYAPGTLVTAARQEYRVAANWKVLVENYHECYHCPSIHPELCEVSPPTSGRNLEPHGHWIGGTMRLRPSAATMSLDGATPLAPLPGLDATAARTVGYFGLLPNLLLSLHPDYVLAHRLEPRGPAETVVECTWLFDAGAASAPGFDPSYAVDFWDRTNAQDWRACEAVQRGVASRGYRPGPLAPGEDAVHRFVTTVAAGYLEGLAR